MVIVSRRAVVVRLTMVSGQQHCLLARSHTATRALCTPKTAHKTKPCFYIQNSPRRLVFLSPLFQSTPFSGVF